jgi:catalase
MKAFKKMKNALEKEGAMLKLIAPHGGTITCDDGMEHQVDAAISTTESVLFDALYIPGGSKAVKAMKKEGKYIKFINEAFKHCKAIAVDGEGEDMLDLSFVKDHKEDASIHVNATPKKFVESISMHRNWDRREVAGKVPV